MARTPRGAGARVRRVAPPPGPGALRVRGILETGRGCGHVSVSGGASVASGRAAVAVYPTRFSGYNEGTSYSRIEKEPRMDIKVSGRKTTVTDALRARVDEKVGEACKVFDIDPMTVDVVLRYEKNPSNPNPAIVEVTVRARGSVIRVAEHGADMYAAIDASADKVARQLRKFKTKVVDRRQQGPSAAEVAPVEPVEDLADLLIPEDADDQLVREKVIDITPMTEEQALVQTDLLGHDFYVFENATTGLINVVYHRKNGGYGIIKPKIEDIDG